MVKRKDDVEQTKDNNKEQFWKVWEFHDQILEGGKFKNLLLSPVRDFGIVLTILITIIIPIVQDEAGVAVVGGVALFLYLVAMVLIVTNNYFPSLTWLVTNFVVGHRSLPTNSKEFRFFIIVNGVLFPLFTYFTLYIALSLTVIFLQFLS